MGISLLAVGFLAGSPATRINFAKKLTLKELLGNIGINAIPIEAVAEQKRMELRKLRPGALKYWAPIFNAIMHILRVISFSKMFTELGKKYNHWWVSAAWLSVLGVSLFKAMDLAQADSVELSFLFASPILSFVAGYAITGIIGNGRLGRALMSRWEIIPAQEYTGMASEQARIFPIPPHLSQLGSRASTIPGTEVMVEYIEDDPFLTITRGRGPFREIVRIGAWNTGNSFLDHFAD